MFCQTSIGQAQNPKGDKNNKPEKSETVDGKKGEQKDDKKPEPKNAKKKGEAKGNRVIVTPIGKPKKGPQCGSVIWPVYFELENVTKSGGWIIQEIEVSSVVWKCGKPDLVIHEDDPEHFWEAWWVPPNDKTPAVPPEPSENDKTPVAKRTSPDKKADDVYRRIGYRSGTRQISRIFREFRGKVEVKGWIRFYEGRESLPKSFKKGKVTVAGGILYSSYKKPPMWDRKGAARHNLIWPWNCCTFEDAPAWSTIPKTESTALATDPPPTSGSSTTGGSGRSTTGTTKNSGKKETNSAEDKTDTDEKSEQDDKQSEEDSGTSEDQSSTGSTSSCCGGSSTAIAEVVLPKGTPVVTAPVITGSQIRFNEPGTVFIATATATAGVVEDPQDDAAPPRIENKIVERRVRRGDQIPADDLVAILLDSGLGIIPPHVSQPDEITVHTGRDEIVHETSDASQTDSTADSDEQAPQVSLNNGTFVASILSDQPYAQSEVETGEGSKSSSQTHIEILVDGKKQGEVTTFSGVDPKLAKEKPLHFRTRDEDGKVQREGKFEGKVVDVTLKVRFDKPVYRLGGQGVLLIWNQQTFFDSQQKNRIGGPTKPSDWILTISPSGSVAGLPRKAGFDTHRLPFTVVGKGQLRATVRAVLKKPAASSDSRQAALLRAN